MRARTTHIVMAVLVTWLVTACSQWDYVLGTSLADAELPQDNTPLQEVLEKLGPPLRMTATDTGFVLAWEHWHIRENSVGVSLGALGAEFLSADWGEMRVKGDFLLLSFDKQHLLTSATSSQWDNYGGGGKSIQPFFGFISVVDTDDLTGPMPQHRWGSAILQRRLATTLNSGSNSDTGQNGLQRRGTPTAIGQQSLEID
jgi:hypothetical protein